MRPNANHTQELSQTQVLGLFVVPFYFGAFYFSWADSAGLKRARR
jgi:hypothetical protein